MARKLFKTKGGVMQPITFKVVEFVCGCRYLWTPDRELRPAKCPTHKSVQKNVTLWCLVCQKKQTVIPLSGQRLRCYECNRYKNKTDNKKAKQEKRKEDPLSTAEGIRNQQRMALNAWHEEMRDLGNWQIPKEVRI